MTHLLFEVAEALYLVSDRDVDWLLGELFAVRVGTSRRAQQALTQIGEARRMGVPVRLGDWQDADVHALARALDHCRNALLAAPEEHEMPVQWPLFGFRNAVIDVDPLSQPRTYHLAALDGKPRRFFFSFTGDYGTGDRLVYTAREAFRVLAVEPASGSDGRLICETWATQAATHR